LSELLVRKLYRWTRPCFSRFMQVPFAHQREVAPFNALNRRSNLLLGPFLARFFRSEVPPNSGQTSPSPVASTGGRSVNLEPLWERTGGTQTHSRRTRSKLRQLRCTRQGLVRVPESNTKYGGKRRKTGVASCPLCRQVSVSPQGFPSEKNCFHRASFSFVPLFTGQLFIVAEGLLSRDSRKATDETGLACPQTRGRNPRSGARCRRFHPDCRLHDRIKTDPARADRARWLIVPRHRTIRSKGCLSNRTVLAMVFKLLEGEQKSWRRLDGHNQLPKLVVGVTFNDGIEVIAKPTDRQPATAAA
jgi:hypothetical protein